MKDSDKRIAFIAEYISAYEEKIRLLNSNGLFDAAKLFELFAIEVGSLYFGQGLSNLNVNTYTYPCVDLISADKQTYIQVSTAKNIPAKIKATLEKIKDSKLPEIALIKNVKFFMLNNESIAEVKDYIGSEQIGNISFVRATDLITSKDILQKASGSATGDLDFQIDLYNLLKKEADNIKDNSNKINEAIEISKSIGLANIDCKINNEYEIDRSNILSIIASEKHKNISVQGSAGSGKSVLCKKLVEGEENIIYARAERFIEESNINDIWGFDVKRALEYLNNKPMVFFIDSLEFIADSRTKLDLLSILYEYAKDYPAVKIVTSCRTSDKNAFFKIESNYSVQSYEVSELTSAEQVKIANRYPIIKKMMRINSYIEILKSPFYINLIVSKITDICNISDENQLREHIWNHCVCLNDNNVKKAVESIVFTRAKNFLVGADISSYDNKLIARMISQGVLVNNGNTVRLKYDIFEDICFEQYLDAMFDKCKGKYDEFFKTIEAMGRCVYRRYQIWISNKLLAKINRDKFLFELVFSDKMPQFWRKQTIIGLVKSRFCEQFFIEYGQTIIDKELLNEFIKIANLYAFEIQKDTSSHLFYIQLHPSGEGRKCLIHLIAQKKIYENSVFKHDLEKLCSDYAKVQLKDKQTSEEACLILQYIIEKHKAESTEKNYYKLDKIINQLLASVYLMAEYSRKWIQTFWVELISDYKGEDTTKERLAESIIEDTIEFKHTKLAEFLPMELCALAEMFWIYSPNEKRIKNDNFRYYHRDEYDKSFQYGLSEKAESYGQSSTRSTVIDSNFFYILFQKHFWEGLNWAIEFVNYAVVSLNNKQKDGLPSYEVNFIENGQKKSYLGYSDMWLVTAQEYSMPTVISDLIYVLKEKLRYVIENDLVVNKATRQFAESVRDIIYEKSNNIALLTVIADIGMEFPQKLPGFALDLLTNLDIVLNDLSRFALLVKNPLREMLERQIWMTVSMPFPLPDRYNKKEAKQYDLITYACNSQIYGEADIRKKCHKIFDYLYTITPNNEEHAKKYLQIQKMDLRTAKVVEVDERTLALIPTVTGEAEKLTIENADKMQPENAIALLLKQITDKMSQTKFCLQDNIEAIGSLLEASKNCITPSAYDEIIIALITGALKDAELDKDNRAKFCQIWIDGINSYFSMGSFIYEYSLSGILFSQVESNVSDNIKNQIKRLILNLLLDTGQNGVISRIAYYAKRYLTTNQKLAQNMYHTICMLAQDEMNHQKFNAAYLKKHQKKEKFTFQPNQQPKLYGVDSWLEEKRGVKFQSRKEEIIQQYLFNDADLKLCSFNIDNYDITTMCYAMSCGLSIDDAQFASIVKKLLSAMIKTWDTTKHQNNVHEILHVYALSEVREFFQKELLKSDANMKITLTILFDNVDFSIFTRKTIEFYLEIFGTLLAEYFYAHSDNARRSHCENILKLLEQKVLNVKEKNIKITFYKSLILSTTRYCDGGDWSKCASGYSYKDKLFLNCYFSKYGGFYLENMLYTMYKLHIDKLLPEILLSVRDAFKFAIDKTKKTDSGIFKEDTNISKPIILMIITKAFLNWGDKIKQDDDLTKAFEEVLEMLVDMSFEEAAVILDEFRIH